MYPGEVVCASAPGNRGPNEEKRMQSRDKFVERAVSPAAVGEGGVSGVAPVAHPSPWSSGRGERDQVGGSPCAGASPGSPAEGGEGGGEGMVVEENEEEEMEEEKEMLEE